ncbi:MAG: zinc ribbon domain-containing protein [Pyrinomonadaceae bacterium]
MNKGIYYCPRCGNPHAFDQARFCPNCGMTLIGIPDAVNNGGMPPAPSPFIDPSAESPKRTGIRQGGLIMLSGFFLVPLVIVISVALHLSPALTLITGLVTFWGGLLRILYAAIFQSGVPTKDKSGFFETLKNDMFPAPKEERRELESATFQEYVPINWRETEELTVGLPKQETNEL